MKIFLKMKLIYFMTLSAQIMGDSVENLLIKLDSWMKDLSPYIKDMPLYNIAIPGCHDSMTFDISRDKSLGPDADTYLTVADFFLDEITVPWCKTQNLNTMQQLLVGIRLNLIVLEACAKPVLYNVLPIIVSDFTPGGLVAKRPAPVNVVMGDFIDLENNLFPRTIIALNDKLRPPTYPHQYHPSQNETNVINLT